VGLGGKNGGGCGGIKGQYQNVGRKSNCSQRDRERKRNRNEMEKKKPEKQIFGRGGGPLWKVQAVTRVGTNEKRRAGSKRWTAPKKPLTGR